MFDNQSVHPSYVVYHYVWHVVYHYVWLSFQAKNNARSTPACAALAQVPHQSHSTHTANCYLHGKGERNGIQRRTGLNFSRTMMQALHGAAAIGKKARLWKSDIKI